MPEEAFCLVDELECNALDGRIFVGKITTFGGNFLAFASFQIRKC